MTTLKIPNQIRTINRIKVRVISHTLFAHSQKEREALVITMNWLFNNGFSFAYDVDGEDSK